MVFSYSDLATWFLAIATWQLGFFSNSDLETILKANIGLRPDLCMCICKIGKEFIFKKLP
jgi:hypothetical protein